MVKEEAIKILVSLAKSIKSGLRATEAEHKVINEAIAELEEKPVVAEEQK